MKHTFISGTLDSAKCAVCHFDEISHGNEATCDCCPNIGPVELMYGNMRMCNACIEREKATSESNSTPEKQQERIDAMNAALSNARKIDGDIEVKTDLFNAATESIVKIKALIDVNPEITNKPYALAEQLTARFNHFKTVVFELNQQIVAAGNEQKAIQVYLNQLANKLTAEAREKLKINDINYNPTPAKIVKPKAIKTTSKKLDKAEIRKYAAELGIAEFTLQALVVMKGCTVEQAANLLRKSIAESKSEAGTT